MPAPTLRRITSADAADVERALDVWRRARWRAQPWLEQRMGHSRDDDRRFLRGTLLRRHEMWVAEEASIRGLLVLGAGTVEQLHVAPEDWGRGLGTALLDHAKALRPEGLTLFTHRRNLRARAFYERRGFRVLAFGTSPAPESEPDVRYGWRPGPGR